MTKDEFLQALSDAGMVLIWCEEWERYVSTTKEFALEALNDFVDEADIPANFKHGTIYIG